MDQPYLNPPSRNNPCAIHRDLLAYLTLAGELNVEWKTVHHSAHSNHRLPKTARLAIALIAWRAQSKCGAVADTVIAGMLCLVRGETQRAMKKLRSCRADMAFLDAADRTVAAIIRKSITRVRHGK